MTDDDPKFGQFDNGFFSSFILIFSLALLLLILLPPAARTTVPASNATAKAQMATGMETQTVGARFTPLAPERVLIGRWQWQRFTTSAAEYPPVQLWFDVSEGGEVSGVLSIYPNTTDLPPQARTLVQQNGCNVTFETLDTAPVSGMFVSATEAFVRIEVSECTIKYFGPYRLTQPVNGQFTVAYDEIMTQLLLNPAEPTPIERGRRVFAQYCSGCHGSYAEGAPGIPSLKTDQVRAYTDAELSNIVRNGVINTTMPAWGAVLSEEDILGVLELVRSIDLLGG